MYLGLVVAIAIAASVTLVQAASAEIGLQRTVRSLGDDGFVRITQSDVTDPQTLARFTSDTRRQAAATSLLTAGASYLVTTNLFPSSKNGGPPAGLGSNQPYLAYYAGLDGHVDLVDGQMPTQAGAGGLWQVVISEAAQKRLGLESGDAYCLSDLRKNVCLRVAGVWRARDPSSAWWGPDRVPSTALLVPSQEAYFELLRELPDARSFGHSTFVPDPATFRQFQLDQVLDRFRQLRGYYTVLQSRSQVATVLDIALERYRARFQRAQVAVQLVSAQILLVALFYLTFSSGHVLDQQRQAISVWRSRGWRRRDVWALLMLEFFIMALLSVPAGLALGILSAAGAVRMTYGSLDLQPLLGQVPALWQPAAVAFVLGLLILVLRAASASRQGLVEARSQASRPELRPWWQWRYVDVGLALLGFFLLLKTPLLAEAGSAGGAVGEEPTVLALLGVGLILLPLACLRLLPPVARLGGAARRGLALRLASWQLSRRPIQHSQLALLLLFAIALGVLASTYLTTERRNSADRAAYLVGSDIRAHFSGENVFPPARQVSQALAVSDTNVTASSLVYRGSVTPGNSILQPVVLGVDPYTFGRVAWSRPGLEPEPLTSLLQRLVPKEGVAGMELPGQPERLGLWVQSPGLNAQVSAVVEDSAGRPAELLLGGLDYTGWRYLEAPVPLRGAGIRYPLHILRLYIHQPPEYLPGATTSPPTPKYPAYGRVAISDLGVIQPGAQQPTVVSAFSDLTATGWFATESLGGLSRGPLKASASLLREGQPASPLTANVGDGDLVIRPSPSLTTALPALVRARTLQRLGIPAGIPFEAHFGPATLLVYITGVVEYFPTLAFEDSQDFLIVDRDPLLDRLAYGGEPKAWPNEVWLTTSGRDDPSIVRRLQGSRGVDRVVSRRGLLGASQSDLIALELEANLLIGFAAALALAVAAFALHFLVATRGRRSEYAILDANGLSPRTIQRSLALEQGVLLLFSLVVGAALGILVSWLVLPAVHLGASLEETIPPTLVSVSGPLTGASLAVVLGLAMLAGLWATRLARRFELPQQLRMLS